LFPSPPVIETNSASLCFTVEGIEDIIE